MDKLILILLFLLTVFNANSQSLNSDCSDAGVLLKSMPSCNNEDYYILFEDNFENDSLDLSKWSLAAYGVGQQYGLSPSQEFYVLDNMEISNGICKLIAKRETVMGRAISWKPDDEILEDGFPNYREYSFTSSRLTAIEDICLYGKYEIRCRLPKGKGFWPSFWIYSGPRWNELDFFDNMDGCSKYSCGPGYDYDGDGSSEGCRWGTTNIPDLSEWHTYTVFYNFDRIIWQIDNETIRTLYRYHTLSGLPVVCGDNITTSLYFQKESFPIDPMHLIIEFAIRNGDEAPDENTVLPASFEIDYIRYWVKPGQNHFLNSFLDKEINIFPNPANNSLEAAFTLNYQSPVSYSILDVLGTEVLHKENITALPGKNDLSVDVASLLNGIYLMRIMANREVISKKFIISR